MTLDLTLARLAQDPTTPVDLAEVALQLARDEYAQLDISHYLGQLDELGSALQFQIQPDWTLSQKLATLVELLYDQARFHGNTTNYYDPRNSYLNEVLDRRQGLPITLALVAIAVGQRAGLLVSGVALPGHFIARIDQGREWLLFDPFHGGQILNVDACSLLVSTITGHPFIAMPDDLSPTASGSILLRLLNNLRGVAIRSSDWPRAVRVLQRMIQLAPQDSTWRRDLGLVYIQWEKPGLALEHLRVYLASQPQAPDAEAIQEYLKSAIRELARRN